MFTKETEHEPRILRHGPRLVTPYDLNNLPSGRTPRSLDLRKSLSRNRIAIVSMEVKFQGQCDACWVFSAIGLAEASYAKKHNHYANFSEQNLIDCVGSALDELGIDDKCSKSHDPESALEYILEYGIHTVDTYGTYKAYGYFTCKHTSIAGAITDLFTKIYYITNDEEAIKGVLSKLLVPVIAVLKLPPDDTFNFYGKGIFFIRTIPPNPDLHTVELIGFGTESNGANYWIARNNWGSGWGENGFIRIVRTEGINELFTSRLIFVQ